MELASQAVSAIGSSYITNDALVNGENIQVKLREGEFGSKDINLGGCFRSPVVG